MNNLSPNAGGKRPVDAVEGIEFPLRLPSEIPDEDRVVSNSGLGRDRGALDIPDHVSFQDDISTTDVSSITTNMFPPHCVGSIDLHSNIHSGGTASQAEEASSHEFIQRNPRASQVHNSPQATENGACPQYNLRRMEQGIIRKGLISSVPEQITGNKATTQTEIPARIALACVGLPVLQDELVTSQGTIQPQAESCTEGESVTRSNSPHSARGNGLSTTEQLPRSNGTSRDQGHYRETEMLMDIFESLEPSRNQPHAFVASFVVDSVDYRETSQPGAFRCGSSSADNEPRNAEEGNDTEGRNENMEERPEIILEATLYEGRESGQNSEIGDESEDVQEEAHVMVVAVLMDAKFVAANFFISRQGRAIALLFLLIFTVLSSVMVVFLRQQQHKQQNESTDTVAPGVYSTSPSSPQALSPTSAPTVGFSIASLPYHTQQSINDTTSPQSRAWEWVRSDPNFQDLPPDRAIQRFVLATFYKALHGDAWVNNYQWMNYSAHECFDWYTDHNDLDEDGSKCNSDGILVHLHSRLNAMMGTIPPELALLSGSLESLSIPQNNIRGTLPTELGLLTKLHHLLIHENMLSGTIPSELFLLTHIKEFRLDNNSLRGTLSTLVGQLSSLEDLSLGVNRLSGVLPTEVVLPSLVSIYVEENKLTGTLPMTVFQNSSFLEYFQVQSNLFSGSIPSDIGRLSRLKRLTVSNNLFTGRLPREVWSLPMIRDLLLSENDFSAAVLPEEIFGNRNLNQLIATGCHFTGSLPLQMWNGKTLETLHLQGNSFSGTIPEPNEGSLLTDLKLGSNLISGNIPSQFGKLVSLSVLDLSENRFFGPIPSELGLLRRLSTLLLNGNNLKGSIPSDLFGLTRLKELTLHNNLDLIGQAPEDYCSIYPYGGIATVDCERVGCDCCECF